MNAFKSTYMNSFVLTFRLVLASCVFLMFGAACQTKTTPSTNTSSTLNTNHSVQSDNSRRTGEFSTAPTNQAVRQTVTISGSGYDRPTIRVSVGDRVEFRNGDTRQHHLASDPHPTHTDLPDFDLTLESGGTSTYTFLKVGTFSYHDHNQPENEVYHGQVIVEE